MRNVKRIRFNTDLSFANPITEVQVVHAFHPSVDGLGIKF